MRDDFIVALRQKLNTKLPAYSAQKLMEPPMRKTFELDSSKAKKAATILLLFYEQEWKFILIQRSSHPLDKHKGQISFPGGSIEVGESSDQAAVREAEEEIGLAANDVELIGKLSDLFIPVSNFIVSPYVAFAKIDKNKLVKQEAEVAEILSIKLADFMNDENIKKRSMKMSNGMTIKDIPYYDLNEKIVWGATAMMLSEFREVVKEIK